MKFRIGDKLKVINIKHCQSCNIGEIVKVVDVEEICKRYSCRTSKGLVFYFEESELEKLDFTKADLKDGDKCTLKNGQVIFVDKTSDYGFSNINEQLKYFNDDVSIIKVERPVKYETMFERKEEILEEILDEVEKKYLADVVRPFRSKVRSVYKIASICSNKEFINIQLRDENFTLPYFKKGTMYKEMQTGKRYTLEKLGL